MPKSYMLRVSLALMAGLFIFTGCGDSGAVGPKYPQGRIVTANQDANTLSVIDVATNTVSSPVPTGTKPHHVLATPNGKELWVTLYGETRLQVFSVETMTETASVDVGSPNDDLVFNPSGDRVYVSMGQKNEVAIIDVAKRMLLSTIKVGKTPHGLRVTPDGKYLLVTNTLDNTVSMISLEGEPAIEATIKTGTNPFEVVITSDSATAYVSNFLGDSISVIDLSTRKTVGYIRSGKKPAMLALSEGSITGATGTDNGAGKVADTLWVANTSSNDLWKIDAVTRTLITRIAVGRGAHGVLPTSYGKLYVTNTEDNTISVVDTNANLMLLVIGVGAYPNGLTYLPPDGDARAVTAP